MSETDYARIEKAIRYIGKNFKDQPKLEEVARATGLSQFHFQRLFRRWAGVSPKGFLRYLTAENAKHRLRESRSVLDAAFDSGLSAPSRLHDLLLSVEAMTPGEFKEGGKGLEIQYGTHPTPFGPGMAALTRRGLCGFSFLGSGGERTALSQLKRHWPKAHFSPENSRTGKAVDRLFKYSSKPKTKRLKVLLKGSPFQLKVWEALLKIPPGRVLAYGDLARMIGEPKASRAVGTAIGQNVIAYLIPCHRVIRETGDLGQYRWGSTRKKAILAWEEAKVSALP